MSVIDTSAPCRTFFDLSPEEMGFTINNEGKYVGYFSYQSKDGSIQTKEIEIIKGTGSRYRQSNGELYTSDIYLEYRDEKGLNEPSFYTPDFYSIYMPSGLKLTEVGVSAQDSLIKFFKNKEK